MIGRRDESGLQAPAGGPELAGEDPETGLGQAGGGVRRVELDGPGEKPPGLLAFARQLQAGIINKD